MPAATIHRCVGKKILEITNMYTDEYDKKLFEIGCVAPDSWKNTSRYKNSPLPKKIKRRASHFSPEGKYIEYYLNFYDKYKPTIDDPFMMGYLIHLMTDFYWRYIMFYNYFNRDGSIRLLDGSSVNGEKGVRKTLLKNETAKIATLISKEYKLKWLDQLSDNEIERLTKIDELEYDGLNETLIYDNKEANDTIDYELKVYRVKDFKNGITKCSNIIIGELGNIGIAELL